MTEKRRAPERLDIPVYLDAGVALSLSASLNRGGLVLEKTVETATAQGRDGSAALHGGLSSVVSVQGHLGTSRSVAVTENEIRKYTQESIFNSVRDALQGNGLLRIPSSPWADADWRIGEFVDFTTGRIVVPLVSALSRVRVIAESFAFVTSELSAERLQKRVPQILQQLRSGTDADADDDMDLDQVLSFLTETGEIARALAGVVGRLEAEAEESGLVDVVMFEDQMTVPQIVAVASLDRDYVDTKLLRRLGQGHFGVLGKVMRSPEPETAFNAFRNSMLGATNQLPVLLTRFHSRLFELPLLLGDGVNLEADGRTVFLNFVGSASAITELYPIWTYPSVEIFPVAIYA